MTFNQWMLKNHGQRALDYALYTDSTYYQYMMNKYDQWLVQPAAPNVAVILDNTS